jgi:uncharacterized protein (TIGR02145 family)
MAQLSSLGVAVANQSGAVEFRDHFKNGASSKSQMSRGGILCLIAIFMLFENFCFGQQEGVASSVSAEKSKQEVLISGQGVEINGIVWATSDVGIRGSFVSHSKEAGSRFSAKEYNVCPSGWRLPTKDEFENLLKSSQEFTSDGIFIGEASNRIFLSFNKRDGDIGMVNYWSGSYKMAERLITRRPFKCRYYLSIHSDYAPDVYDGALKEQMKCRCVLDTAN